MKKKIWIAVVLVLVALIGAAGAVVLKNYTWLDGRLISNQVEKLDLSGKPLESLEKLCSLKNLKELNLEGTGISVAEYERLHQALPGCNIRWQLSFQGQSYHHDITSLALTALTDEDLLALTYLKKLQMLDMTGSGISIDQYETLCATLPGCRIRWEVPFQGGFYAPDTTALTVQPLTESDFQALAYLPALAQIDATALRDEAMVDKLFELYPDSYIRYTVTLGSQELPENAASLEADITSVEALEQAMERLSMLERVSVTGCRDYAGLMALQERYPDCAISYEIYLGDRALPYECRELTVKASEYDTLMTLMPYFPCLEDVSFQGQISESKLHAIADAYPNTRFHYSFTLLGKKVHTDDEKVILDNIKMKDTQELEAMLHYFHNLKQVDMVGCGISNPDMEALNNRNPETLFVWTVKLHAYYFRTDIKYYYPLGDGIIVEDRDIVNLRYCTQLEALDLGHFELKSCEFLQYMPKLKYLVLGISEITDVSPIGTLKELKFLELFLSEVTDYWPLINCTALEDLNLSYCGHGDITPLLQMPWLNRLWLCNHQTTAEEKALLHQALPNTLMVFQSKSSTDKGWRNSPHYFAMRDMIGGYYMIH